MMKAPSISWKPERLPRRNAPRNDKITNFAKIGIIGNLRNFSPIFFAISKYLLVTPSILFFCMADILPGSPAIGIASSESGGQV